MRFLTADEVEDLAAAHPERYRAMVLVAAYGGFRFGELAGLRRRRIDLTGTVRIEETCVEVAGKLVWGAPKTEAGRRSVALPSFIASALRDHQATYSQAGPDGLVFTAPEGGPLRRSNYRHKVWLPAIARAGLDGLRFHDLRHTAVALWIAAGANVLEVKQRAGHTRSTFTLDRYGHLFPHADKGLASRLDDLYGRKGLDASGDVRRLSS
jgi:integrase